MIPEAEYIQGLKVPDDSIMDFETIFEKALNNIAELWADVISAKPAISLDTLISWSLDTGIDENNSMIYWN